VNQSVDRWYWFWHLTANTKFHTSYTLIFVPISPSGILDEFSPFPFPPALVGMVGLMGYGSID
jgi:hypothetical protein